MQSPTPDPISPAGYTFWTSEHVRFADLDVMGHVNSVAFAVYFESGRIAMLRSLGFHESAVDRGIVLAHLSVDYRGEVHYPAQLRIGTRIERIGRSSFDIGYAVFVGDRCAATGRGVSVRVDREGHRPVPLTDAEIAQLKRCVP